MGRLAYHGGIGAAYVCGAHECGRDSCLIRAVIDRLALDALRDGVLTLTGTIRLRLFKRPGFARIGRVTLLHRIRSRLICDLRCTSAGCKDGQAEKGHPLGGCPPPGIG